MVDHMGVTADVVKAASWRTRSIRRCCLPSIRMFPSSCQQLPTIQWSPIPSAIFFRIFGGCSMLMVRNAATGGPTSPTVSKGLRTVSALPISPRNCRSYRRRTRIGSWDAPLSRDSTGPRSNATARRTRSLRSGFASIADFLDGYKFDRGHASWANQPPLSGPV